METTLIGIKVDYKRGEWRGGGEGGLLCGDNTDRDQGGLQERRVRGEEGGEGDSRVEDRDQGGLQERRVRGEEGGEGGLSCGDNTDRDQGGLQERRVRGGEGGLSCGDNTDRDQGGLQERRVRGGGGGTFHQETGIKVGYVWEGGGVGGWGVDMLGDGGGEGEMLGGRVPTSTHALLPPLIS